MNIWRALRYLLLLLFVLLAAGVLCLRYWFLPQIDQYRPHIIRYIEQYVGLHVELDHLSADWRGLNPNIAFTGLVVSESASASPVLRLPRLDASLSWRSVWEGKPVFRHFFTQGLELDVRRDQHGVWWVLNQPIDMQASDNEASALDVLLPWLSRQRHISISDSTLRWRDETRASPDLVLEQVNLALFNKRNQHTLELRALPAPDMGGELLLRWQGTSPIVARDQQAGTPYHGRLFIATQDMVLNAWEPWLGMPEGLQAGRLTLHASTAYEQGQWQDLRVDAWLKNGLWQQEGGEYLGAESARLYLQTSLDALLQSVGSDQAAQVAPIQLQLQAKQLQWQLPAVFAQGLSLDAITLQGQMHRDKQAGWSVQLGQLDVQHADVAAALRADWQQGQAQSSGHLSLSGDIAHLDLARLVDYLPLTVEVDARHWMRESIVSGAIKGGRIELEGEIDAFPFGLNPQAGHFLVEGPLTDGVIDYLPAKPPELGWPRLEQLQGTIRMQNAALDVQATGARMPVAGQSAIALERIQAQIDNLERQSVLTLQGVTQAAAPSYLALFSQTPLGGMLDHLFDQAQGVGQWRMPLSLKVPLLHSEETTVKGELQFKGAELRLLSEAPWLRHLQGTLSFSERGVAAQGLQGRLLGGPVSISGRMEPGSPGLRLQGTLLTENLARYIDSQALDRLSGAITYDSTLFLDKQGSFGMDLESSLQGVASRFPAPMDKQTEQSMPLTAQWRGDSNGKQAWLDVALQTAPVTHLRLLREYGQHEGSFFQAMLVSADGNLPFPSSGTTVDGRYQMLDLDEWDTVLDEFALPWASAPVGAQQATHRRVLPPMARSRIKAERGRLLGVALDQLTLSSIERADGHFRVDISSAQTAGTIQGQMHQRQPVGAWDVRFHRLSLGHKETQSDSEQAQERTRFLDQDQELVLPDIKVQVDHLVLYERSLGRLSMVGKALNSGRQWRLENLQLSGDGLELEGDGYWQLRGLQRGLHLSAQAQVENLGLYVNQLGVPDVLQGGSGSMKANFFWHDFPWSMERSSIQGYWDLALRKGRFSQVGSRSARMLELISLQSLSRLASLDFNPAGLFKDGFPFDEWRGELELKQGLLTAKDYRIQGPVGLIELDGHMRLEDEGLDFQATVLPKLDVSGAAVAAGVVINPFVGLGTLLAQWVLQDPLAQGMALRYHIGGTLDEPKIEELNRPVPDKPNSTSGFIEPQS